MAANGKGAFVWYEYMSGDAPTAEAFYGHVAGWQIRDAGMPGMKYGLLHAGEAPVGGMMGLPAEACEAEAKPGWTGYIGVDDVDVATRNLTEAGGIVARPPDDIPGVGRFAVVTDPHGACFVLFKGNGPEPVAPPPDTPGHFGWRELHAGEGGEAFAFYSRLFGWEKAEAMDMGPMGIYQLFSAGAGPIGAMMTKTKDTPAPFWLYYINVEDIDAASKRVTDKGGRIVFGPEKVPGEAWIIHGTDPEGASFALLGPRR